MKKTHRDLPGSVRIIGGKWRGRGLPVGNIAGLRPTPDRVRETLFNWLAPVIVRSRCLDLFAGTGALGFEAASRGAAEVILIERDPRLARILEEQSLKLGAQEVTVVCAKALEWLKGPASAFDVVFLDPPFGQGLLGPCCEQLEARNWLKPGAWIYLETERALLSPPIPPHWRIERAKQAGQVRYYLARSHV